MEPEAGIYCLMEIQSAIFRFCAVIGQARLSRQCKEQALEVDIALCREEEKGKGNGNQCIAAALGDQASLRCAT